LILLRCARNDGAGRRDEQVGELESAFNKGMAIKCGFLRDNAGRNEMLRVMRGCVVLIVICFALVVHGQDFESVKRAAEQGQAVAQNNLGVMYDNGQSVTQSYAEAVKWYRKAAEQGQALAQYNLGVMYEKGQGLAQNEAEAVKWYRKAAEQGYVDAQYNLGVMYEKGQGVAKSYAEAVKWYRKAAEQGDADAQGALEDMKNLASPVAK